MSHVIISRPISQLTIWHFFFFFFFYIHWRFKHVCLGHTFQGSWEMCPRHWVLDQITITSTDKNANSVIMATVWQETVVDKTQLFNGTPNTFLSVVMSASETWLWKERKEMFYLTMHSTYFIYSYMVLDIW